MRLTVLLSSGGDVDAAAAAVTLQSISGYDGSASDYDITDTAAALISATDSVLNVDGVDTVSVTGGPVDADTGEKLAELSKDVEFDVLDDANAVAAEVTGSNGAGDLDEANSVVVSGGDIDAAEAAAIQSISGYDGSASDYDITDTAAALISATDSVLNVDGVDTVSVTGGPVDADTGEALAELSKDVEFDVLDDANAVAAEVTGSNGAGDLDEANSVVVSGGDVDAAEAAAIQSISGYDGSASDYDITDTAAALISATDSVLDVDGVDTVSVTGGPVDADTGEKLAELSKDVEFDVLDDANAVAAEVTGSNGAGDLDEANSVVVSGGDIDAAEAADIQSISGYDGSASDYDITDTAAALISATDSVLNVDGVDTVSVTGGPVDADTGEKLAELSKDVEFDVLDDANAVAAEVTGSNGAGDLDEANSVVVSGGDIDAADAAVVQSISGYDGSASDYDITDTAAALISVTDSVLNVDGVDTVSVTGGPVDADTGEALAELSKDVEFDVLDDANAVAAEVTGSNGAGDLDEANSVVVSGGDVDAAEAAAIQSISGYDGSASDYDITDTAAALISATDSVLNVDGVDTVSVTGGPVDADTGATLNNMSADIEFDVTDTSSELFKTQQA